MAILKAFFRAGKNYQLNDINLKYRPSLLFTPTHYSIEWKRRLPEALSLPPSLPYMGSPSCSSFNVPCHRALDNAQLLRVNYKNAIRHYFILKMTLRYALETVIRFHGSRRRNQSAQKGYFYTLNVLVHSTTALLSWAPVL